ncbi:MAG: STAS domain-containing protein [Planctomycetes bacterium]|nr:STAS domain-containing protein [Planctomycetota bacterium]
MTNKLQNTYHRIGELLVRQGFVQAHHVDEALALQRHHLAQRRAPPRLGSILVERRRLSRAAVQKILEEQRIGQGKKRVLSVNLRKRGSIPILSLSGRLDESKRDAVIRAFERLMDQGFRNAAVDARRLLYLDSRGISAFISYIDEARARGGDVKFFGLSPDSKYTLDRLGLTRFVQTFDSEDEALRAFDLSIDEYMSRGALGEFVSTVDQKAFHFSYCPGMQDAHDEDKVFYESKKHAENAGKLPCQTCNP